MSFFTAKLSEKDKRIEISAEISKDDMDEEEDERTLYYPEGLETFDGETEIDITKARRPKTVFFIKQQKSANTNEKTETHMNTLLRYREADGLCEK